MPTVEDGIAILDKMRSMGSNNSLAAPSPQPATPATGSFGQQMYSTSEQPDSPLTPMDELRMTFSDSEGAMKYLQNKFRFVKQDETGQIFVGDSPSKLSSIKPTKIVNKLIGLTDDIISISGMIAGGTMGNAVAPGAGAVLGSAAGGGAAEAVNIGIGKALGVREDPASEMAVDIGLNAFAGGTGEALGLALKGAGNNVIKPFVKKYMDSKIKKAANPNQLIDGMAWMSEMTSSLKKDTFKSAAFYGFDKTLDKQKYLKEDYVRTIMSDFADGVIKRHLSLGKAVEDEKKKVYKKFGNEIIKGSNKTTGKLLLGLKQGNIGIVDDSFRINYQSISSPDRRIFKNLAKDYFAINPRDGSLVAKDITVKKALDFRDKLKSDIDKYFSTTSSNRHAKEMFKEFFEEIRESVNKTITRPGATPEEIALNPFVSANKQYSQWKKDLDLMKSNGLDATKVGELLEDYRAGKIISNRFDTFGENLAKKSGSSQEAFDIIAKQINKTYPGKTWGDFNSTTGDITDELRKYHAAQDFKGTNPNYLRLNMVVSMLGLGIVGDQLGISDPRASTAFGLGAGLLVGTPAGIGFIAKTAEKAGAKAAASSKFVTNSAKKSYNDFDRRLVLSTLARIASNKADQSLGGNIK